jgi:hypothetical protein
METPLPTGIRLIRIFNMIYMAFFVFVGACMTMIAVPNILMAAQKASKQPNIILVITVGLVSFLIGLIPAALLFKLNQGLKKLKGTAKMWQIVFSLLMLLAFPIGTVLSLVSLYF